MKKQIDVFEYAGHICKAMQKGILLTTKSGETVNTMTIAWGSLGIEWNRILFTAFVRDSRYTRQLLEETSEFTVNIPYGACESSILKYCGTKSGRDVNKIEDLGLTLIDSDVISVPGIQELPLTLECRIIYKQKQEVGNLPTDVIARFYPEMDKKDAYDYHIAYYGEIVNAYLFEK